MLIDSHIHLSHALYDGTFPYINSLENGGEIPYDTRENLIDKIKAAGVAFCIEPGIEFESNEKILALNSKYPDFILPAVGVHPTRTPYTPWKRRKAIAELSGKETVVAIGELGLDYHHDRKEQHRFRQKIWFIWQILLADKRKLPLILHIRLADKDAIKILRFFKKRLHGGVCHCFKSNAETAKIYTEELGLMLGIGGSLLQKQEDCAALEEAVRQTPIEYLLLETDGPYVKPDKPGKISEEQWKKIRNTSLIIPEVAMKIAEIKGIDVREVELVTTENARRVFGII